MPVIIHIQLGRNLDSVAFFSRARFRHPFFASRFLFNFDFGRLRYRRWQGAGIQAVALAIFLQGFLTNRRGFDLARAAAANRFLLFRRVIRDRFALIISIIAWRTSLLRLLRTVALIVTIIVAGIIPTIAAIITTIVRAIIWTIVSARFFTGDTLFFAAGNCIGVHTEIVIGELMIIFGLDAVAIDLRILRHFLEFVEHLRCVSTRAVVDPVITIRSATAVALGAVIGVPAAPTAARLTIVHQILGILIPTINLVFLKS